MATPNLRQPVRRKAHRPELADTQPDLGALSERARPTTLSRMKSNAKPFLIGAGVGAGVTLAIAALTARKPAPAFSLFPEPKSKVFVGIAKIALLAIGRTLVRRAVAHASEKLSAAPA